MGSPPHTWRIRIVISMESIKVRITSTHVENTFTVWTSSSPNWDHLHTRGEYTMPFSMLQFKVGSPPHTWRIHSLNVESGRYAGITSTHVENTLLCQHLKWVGQDHLHTRGEYSLILVNVLLIVGSPPHTWRIQRLKEQYEDETRITSTHVENTACMIVKPQAI